MLVGILAALGTLLLFANLLSAGGSSTLAGIFRSLPFAVLSLAPSIALRQTWKVIPAIGVGLVAFGLMTLGNHLVRWFPLFLCLWGPEVLARAVFATATVWMYGMASRWKVCLAAVMVAILSGFAGDGIWRALVSLNVIVPGRLSPESEAVVVLFTFINMMIRVVPLAFLIEHCRKPSSAVSSTKQPIEGQQPAPTSNQQGSVSPHDTPPSPPPVRDGG